MQPSTAALSSLALPTPGARLHIEVRGRGPALMLVGCPMDATAFAPLAEVLAADHTVITTDPRGINRSRVDDRDRDVTPEELAEDLSRIATFLDLGPMAVFGSSGGAVGALALALAHPGQVHTVIAHEPPLEELLDDREQLRANTEDMVRTYLAGDHAGAWRKFFAGADIVLPDESSGGWPDEPPDPQAMADEHFFFAHTLRPFTWWEPDIAALRATPTRVVVGVGTESSGQVCDRTSTALAEALGSRPTRFPGDHTGFVDHPEHFAQVLRGVLDDATTSSRTARPRSSNPVQRRLSPARRRSARKDWHGPDTRRHRRPAGHRRPRHH